MKTIYSVLEIIFVVMTGFASLFNLLVIGSLTWGVIWTWIMTIGIGFYYGFAWGEACDEKKLKHIKRKAVKP